jgi:hypothetical protein
VAQGGAIVAEDDVRSRRKRAHALGDHSQCRPGCQRRLRVAIVDDVSGLRAAVETEFAEDDELVRSLAIRLATIAAAGHGVLAPARERLCRFRQQLRRRNFGSSYPR